MQKKFPMVMATITKKYQFGPLQGTQQRTLERLRVPNMSEPTDILVLYGTQFGAGLDLEKEDWMASAL